jgi:large-conductance mechanosensitive channel
MKKLLFGLLTVFAIYSCGGGNTDKAYLQEFTSDDAEYDIEMEAVGEMPMTRQSSVAGNAYKKQEPTVSIDKKIIKDARVGVEVEDYYVYRQNIDSLIYSLKAYVSDDNLDKNDYSINSNLTIRIPAVNFDKLIFNLETGTEKLLYKNISARDVTEEFIDIEARLKTKKEVEKRYTQLLAKARNIKEILEVEEKLRVIREEIESREGRLNYLKKQVSYSTIYLQITQKIDYKYESVKEKSFFQRLFKSLDKGWKGFVSFLIFLFRIWPIILIGFAIFFYIRKIRRKKKLIKKQEEEKKNRHRPSPKRYYNKPRATKREDKPESNN